MNRAVCALFRASVERTIACRSVRRSWRRSSIISLGSWAEAARARPRVARVKRERMVEDRTGRAVAHHVRSLRTGVHRFLNAQGLRRRKTLRRFKTECGSRTLLDAPTGTDPAAGRRAALTVKAGWGGLFSAASAQSAATGRWRR